MVLLVLVVWLVYWNSLRSPFQFDDWHVIPQNPSVRGPADIPSFFMDISTFSVLPDNRDYRPVFLTSMALAWWAGNGSTLPFHLVSVFLHTCTVILAFSVYRRTFFKEEPPDSARYTDWAAWIGAALFALHPLASEPVNYISSQSVLLCALFYLLSFRLFLEENTEAAVPGRRLAWLLRVGSYGAYALALLSKPIAITLPLNLLAWELLLARPAQQTSFLQRSRKHLPYLAISAGFILLRNLFVPGPFGGGPARPAWEHYLTQTRAMAEYYLGHALVPLGLSVDREYPTSVSLTDTRVLLALLVLGGLAWLLYRFRAHRAIVFWALWFPICLLVTTYGVILYQVVSEHRVYLSLVGFGGVVALVLAHLRRVVEQQAFFGRPAVVRSVAVVPMLLLISWYGYVTHHRNAVWSSELTLWKSAVAQGGGWRAHMNYALALEGDGQADEALDAFRKAVELGPYAFAHMNLGLAYLRRAETEQGLEHLRTAANLWPDLPEARRYLAYGLRRIGRLDEAEAELRHAISLRPNYVEAYAELATLYEQRLQHDAAAEAYRRLLEIDPGGPWAENRLEHLDGGYAWQEIRQQRYREAVEILERTYRARPADPDVLFNLGFSYQMLGDRENTARAYEDLLSVSPDHRQGNFNLAYLYVHGDSEEDWIRCVTLFERVLEVDPNYDEALFHLATAHRQLGDVSRADKYDRQYIERGDVKDLIERSRKRLGSSGAAADPRATAELGVLSLGGVRPSHVPPTELQQEQQVLLVQSYSHQHVTDEPDHQRNDSEKAERPADEPRPDVR